MHFAWYDFRLMLLWVESMVKEYPWVSPDTSMSSTSQSCSQHLSRSSAEVNFLKECWRQGEGWAEQTYTWPTKPAAASSNSSQPHFLPCLTPVSCRDREQRVPLCSGAWHLLCCFWLPSNPPAHYLKSIAALSAPPTIVNWKLRFQNLS